MLYKSNHNMLHSHLLPPPPLLLHVEPLRLLLVRSLYRLCTISPVLGHLNLQKNFKTYRELENLKRLNITIHIHMDTTNSTIHKKFHLLADEQTNLFADVRELHSWVFSRVLASVLTAMNIRGGESRLVSGSGSSCCKAETNS